MSASTTIPVTITPEAAARAAELGMQAELERILEHTRQVGPGLQAIRVVIRPMYDTHEDTGIRIEAVVDETFRPEGTVWREWEDWFYATFPPQVWEHFEVRPAVGSSHAR
jgi:hypothetical protein